jgi:hypothetical protein
MADGEKIRKAKEEEVYIPLNPDWSVGLQIFCACGAPLVLENEIVDYEASSWASIEGF